MDDLKDLEINELNNYAKYIRITGIGNIGQTKLLKKIKLHLIENNQLKDLNISENIEENDGDDESDVNETIKLKEINLEDTAIAKKEMAKENKKMSSAESNNNIQQKNNLFTFKDIEDSLDHFSGDDEILVERWIKDFESISEMFEWNDIQKFVYSKRLLQGSARQFISAERNIKSYKELKLKLINEFKSVLCVAEVNHQLQRRKKLPTESYREYVYVMQKIGNQIDLDEQSIIFHIVEGIDGDERDKIMILGATNLNELKNKLDAYEKFQNKLKEKSKLKKIHNTDNSPSFRSKPKFIFITSSNVI